MGLGRKARKSKKSNRVPSGISHTRKSKKFKGVRPVSVGEGCHQGETTSGNSFNAAGRSRGEALRKTGPKKRGKMDSDWKNRCIKQNRL